MTNTAEGRRAKRRCARAQVGASMPSAVHYVGYVSLRSSRWVGGGRPEARGEKRLMGAWATYLNESAQTRICTHRIGPPCTQVEDEETPEMIMAKFSALERIQLASKAAAVQPAMTHTDLSSVTGNEMVDSGAASDAEERGDVVRPGRSARGGADDLSEEQLLEVFKQVRTSTACSWGKGGLCVGEMGWPGERGCGAGMERCMWGSRLARAEGGARRWRAAGDAVRLAGVPRSHFAVRPRRLALQTSMFNVRTALADNEALWGIEDLLEHAADR